ncbi:MAG: trypsin-like serine protease [Methylacidiphilales bacterium]|nr:trypsin-like serine protease [Candidatus Methylacidiphilales bacterium]
MLLSIGAIAINTWHGVNAQTTTQKTALKYTSSQNAKGFPLPGKGKAFQPSKLPQANKPDEIPGKRGVIGWDDRTPMLSRRYPWSAIGRVQGFDTEGKGYHCTGTLISEDVVLTNAHCVINPKTRQFSKEVYFLPNVINREVVDKSDVVRAKNIIYGTDFSGSELSSQRNDWAILKLDRPIGLKYGYLGWKSLPSSELTKNQNKYIFVGYSGDFPNNNRQGYEGFTAGAGWTASAQVGCSIVKEEENVLLHDCDTSGGSSGGAIIGIINGKPHIVALNNAEIRNREGRGLINLAVKIDFLDRL